MRQKFTGKLFVTIGYKDDDKIRNTFQTIDGYKKAWRDKGIEILEMNFIKAGKGGAHDCYALGNHYNVTGVFTHEGYNHSTKANIKWGIYHNARHVDYFNCTPILHSSIKLIA